MSDDRSDDRSGGPNGEPDGEDEPTSVWNAVGQNAGYGFTIAASLGLFMKLGWEADERLGTTPLLTIVGAFAGGAAGFYYMFRELVIEPRQRVNEKEGEDR